MDESFQSYHRVILMMLYENYLELIQLLHKVLNVMFTSIYI